MKKDIIEPSVKSEEELREFRTIDIERETGQDVMDIRDDIKIYDFGISTAQDQDTAVIFKTANKNYMYAQSTLKSMNFPYGQMVYGCREANGEWRNDGGINNIISFCLINDRPQGMNKVVAVAKLPFSGGVGRLHCNAGGDDSADILYNVYAGIHEPFLPTLTHEEEMGTWRDSGSEPRSRSRTSSSGGKRNSNRKKYLKNKRKTKIRKTLKKKKRRTIKKMKNHAL